MWLILSLKNFQLQYKFKGQLNDKNVARRNFKGNIWQELRGLKIYLNDPLWKIIKPLCVNFSFQRDTITREVKNCFIILITHWSWLGVITLFCKRCPHNFNLEITSIMLMISRYSTCTVLSSAGANVWKLP